MSNPVQQTVHILTHSATIKFSSVQALSSAQLFGTP